MIRRLKKLMKGVLPAQYHPEVAAIYHQFSSLWYYGKEFLCPCCARSSRKFLAHEEIMLNARCPKCDSHARHRLLWLYLKNKTNLFSEKLKVLHFAPEYRFQKTLSSSPNIEYVSADLSSPLAMIHFDITDIPYESNTIDVILCVHVLEHIPDDKKAMSELFRILQPGGWAILQVPIDYSREQTFEDPNIITPEDRQRFYGQADHVRFYGLDYQKRLEEAGFKVIVDPYVRTLGADLIKKYALDEKEDIYLCIKPVKE